MANLKSTTVNGAFNVTGNSNVGGTLEVTGNSTINGILTVNNNIQASYIELSRVSNHGIRVGTIRGTVVGSQTGEYIHMYERVHIGSPSGWGSVGAPSQGLSVYGGCNLATNNGNINIGKSVTADTNATVNIQGSFSDSHGAIKVTDTRTDAGWHYPFLGLSPNITSGGNIYICIGKACGTGQSAGLRY